MGRVARLILLVVMFVCVVFCVLCCLQNNLVFLNVTYLVGWHGSSCWLLCLCVLCFVFCAVSKTIRCSQVSPISISKNENYELCISAGFFVTTGKKKFQSSVWRVRDQLRPEKKKIQAGNFHYDRKFITKKVPVVSLAGMRSITTGKKKDTSLTPIVRLVLF